MLRRYYRNIGHQLKFFGWGRTLSAHVRRHDVFYDNFEALFTALLLALLIKRYVVEAYKIPSSSMLDTLLIDDRIFVNKFIYDFSDIQVGDVVVFKVPVTIPNYDPAKPYFIKRVVGLPGDTIEIGDDEHIYRNGKPLLDPPFFAENPYYVHLNGRGRFQKTSVPAGQILVFGDNSNNSFDGRFWGPIPEENVMGKAFFRYWPLSRIGPIRGVSVKPRSIPSTRP